MYCINRIRLEFKVVRIFCEYRLGGVLIESDWNLKILRPLLHLKKTAVLIESDWNLKIILSGIVQQDSSVLIESDWNLKSITWKRGQTYERGINRIRLEFKGYHIQY